VNSESVLEHTKPRPIGLETQLTTGLRKQGSNAVNLMYDGREHKNH